MDHDWEIRGDIELDEALDTVASAAEDCASACLEAIGRDEDGPAGKACRSVAGVAMVVAERARVGDPDELRDALSLCARMVESASAELGRIGESPNGESAARAARRCATACRRALILLYATS